MREIKFRAWDKINNRFTGRFCIGDDGSFIDMTSGDNSEWMVVEDMTINRYTGLKDKNGVEIYEGDVVKYVTNYYGKRQERQKVVEWIDDMQDDSFGEPLSMGYRFHGDELEVIGNIYENPELINNIEKGK